MVVYISENNDNEDKSIVEALSALGWEEEKEPDEEPVASSIQEQLNLFKEQNKKLLEDINRTNQENEVVKKEKNELAEKEEILLETLKKHETKIEELETNLESTGNIEEIQRINTLLNEKEEQLKEKVTHLEELNSLNNEQASVIENQKTKILISKNTIGDLNRRIEDLTTQIDQIQNQQVDGQNTIDILQEKDLKIKELNEQIKYLENDSVHKSKFDKVNILIEKKDEIITEKEKAIFEIQNELNSTNQKFKDFQQQLETFSLVKKDLAKKDERIKTLVINIEELEQKLISNSNQIDNLEIVLQQKDKEINDLKHEDLTDSNQLKELEDKLESKINDIKNLEIFLKQKDNEIETLKQKDLTGSNQLRELEESLKDKNILFESLNETNKKLTEALEELSVSNKKLNNKIKESEIIEDKILTDLQVIKDENLKLSSLLVRKDEELIELKKKIKLMRRDLSKC